MKFHRSAGRVYAARMIRAATQPSPLLARLRRSPRFIVLMLLVSFRASVRRWLARRITSSIRRRNPQRSNDSGYIRARSRRFRGEPDRCFRRLRSLRRRSGSGDSSRVSGLVRVAGAKSPMRVEARLSRHSQPGEWYVMAGVRRHSDTPAMQSHRRWSQTCRPADAIQHGRPTRRLLS